MEAHIFQLNCSPGGVPKAPVREAMLAVTGMTDDHQAHTRFHGGPERALCLFSLEQILKLQREGHPIYPGSVGENITVVGLNWPMLEPGRRLSLGEEVVIEISSYTVPCKSIAGSFVGGDFSRISQKTYPGEARLYARVLRPGRLAMNQKIVLL
ncbi:MAG: MOSC domain-containing protein [Pyrinomonadaceae bacterium]